MTTNTEAVLQFEVNLLFGKSKNAIEALNQILSFCEILNEFDKSIIRNIGSNYISDYQLENIEFGSIKTTLTQVLKNIPDTFIEDVAFTKLIGFLLVKTKFWLIKLLSQEQHLSDKSQVQQVTDKINEELVAIGTQLNIIVTQVNNYTVLNAIDELTKETNKLSEKELLEYKSQAGNVYIQKGILINKPKILSELGQRTIVNETTELLKTKKADLLSEVPKWDFLQGKKGISAKMLDTDWLAGFHNREVTIKPEDALMVILRTTHTYTPSFDDKKTDYEIIKIQSVISPELEHNRQMQLS